MLRVLAIDPGLSAGGLAVVEATGLPISYRLLSAIDIPTTGEEHRKRVDVKALRAWLAPFLPIDKAVIERAQLMPQRDKDGRPQGASSGGKYMRAVGYLEAFAILETGGLNTVETRAWKKFFGLISDKDLSVAAAKTKVKREALDVCRGLFPEHAATTFKFQKDHNKAEAALIGRHAAEFFVHYGEGKAPPRQAPGKSRKAKGTEENPNATVRSKPAQGALF